ncbi:PREDICTED: uncharacterized protein LOC108559465 [Nicrophorus vespilloides]|uniref:Uncharacterized protein LOC108559465 n=1 Tax=Nicrophorus vespilloides TaxID=110193 RepID=A0ABM1MCF8_NICVS|nr:PREDICTED: uncharacterized protein LOC108559465 [Nicrophorus vespilloides]
MTQNRKRGRNSHEDETEFMPLSKRINNLHINNGMMLDGSSSSSSMPPGEWGPGPPYFQQQQLQQPQQNLPESPPDSLQSSDWSNTPERGPNPFYLDINKQLYEMYLARTQRTSNN